MSIRSGDFASRMAATFSPFQRSPELRMAMARVVLSKTREISLSLNHSDRFHDGEMRSLLKDLDNTVTALPHELRIRIGGYAPLHQLDSDEAIESWMRARLVKQEEVLTQWLREIDPVFASPAQKCTGHDRLSASARRSPQKETIQQSKQARSIPSKTQIGAGIGEGIEGMSASRKRILGVGLLLICVGSMIEASDSYNGTPSLGWMVAMGATWALVVWLWPERKFQIGRALQLVGKRRQMRTRHKVSNLLKSNFLEEETFEKILNEGKQNSLVNLLPGCATNGWRKMSKHELKDAGVVLEYYLEDRLSSIRRLEKMIRKSMTSEEVLLELARKRKPVTDWRHMNYAEMKMMIAMTSGKKEDFDFLRSR